MATVNLPVALRKGKRRSSPTLSHGQPRLDIDSNNDAITTTPSRRSKRIRFSDGVLPSSTNLIASGITPYLRKTSLQTPKSKRQATPGHWHYIEDIQFTPFKQILDDRIKRRIRRNGLSAEMNEYHTEQKSKEDLKKEIEQKDTELRRLRAELEHVQVLPVEDQEAISPSASQNRVDEVEAELEALRQSFALEDSRLDQSWTHVPQGFGGPCSDGGDTILIYEDDDAQCDAVGGTVDTETITMGLELEAARQAKRSMLDSFKDNQSSQHSLVAFADSPARHKDQVVRETPQTPRTFYHALSKQLKTTTNRAEDAELALKALETEVLSLGFGHKEQTASNAVIAILDHFRHARLDLERVVPGETVIRFENAKVLPELIQKLKHFAHQIKLKETELRAARDQQHNLKGNFEKAIVAAEKANARINDLEAAVDLQAEDMLAVRIRAQHLEKDLLQKEKDVESLSLALNKYRDDVLRLESLILQLEQDHTASTTAMTLNHTQKISDLDAEVAAETRGRRAAEQSAVSRLAKINELEIVLSGTRQHTSDLECRIVSLQSQISSDSTTHSRELGSLNTRISNLSTALTNTNDEVSKLRQIKSKLECRLRDEVENGARAVEAIQADLIRSVAKTNEDKKKYIRGAKVRIANWQMEMEDDESEDASSSVAGPMTPSSLVRFADLAEEIEFTAAGKISHDTPYNSISGSDGEAELGGEHLPSSVEIGRGKLRRSRSADLLPRGLAIGLRSSKQSLKRRYDSGIGMSPVSEADLEAAFDMEDGQTGLITPELSSEADDIQRLRRHEATEVEMLV